MHFKQGIYNDVRADARTQTPSSVTVIVREKNKERGFTLTQRTFFSSAR